MERRRDLLHAECLKAQHFHDPHTVEQQGNLNNLELQPIPISSNLQVTEKFGSASYAAMAVTGVVTFDGRVLEGTDGAGSRPARKAADDHGLEIDVSGPSKSGSMPSYVRFTKAPSVSGYHDQNLQVKQEGVFRPPQKLPSSTKVKAGSKQQFQAAGPLTPPTVSGISCAPRQESKTGEFYSDAAAFGLQTNFARAGQPVKGLSSGLQPPRAPFRSTIKGTSVNKLNNLASLNTQFSKDFVDREPHQGEIKQIRAMSASSSGSSEAHVFGRAGVTVLGASGLPTSAGPWWNTADVRALPEEHVRASSACISEDGFNSEFSWSNAPGTAPESVASPCKSISPSKSFRRLQGLFTFFN